jgi:multidrug efflux pump subunit AcrA (membrane-fusion protein)
MRRGYERFFAGLLLLGIGTITGWSLHELWPSSKTISESGEESPDVAPEEMSVRVLVAPATRGDLSLVVPAVGRIEADPASSVVLSSRAGGRLLEARGANGQTVERGEILARFDPAPLEAAVMEAKSARERAASELEEYERSGRERETLAYEAAARTAAVEHDLARAQVERLTPLQSDGLVADRALVEAKATAERALAERGAAERVLASWRAAGAELRHSTLASALAAAETHLAEAQTVLAAAEVRAPADGCILQFTAHTGDALEPGASLGTLLVADGRRIELEVPSRDLARICVGAAARFEGEGILSAPGTVVEIGVATAAEGGLVDVFVVPDAPSPELRPGLVVRGEIEIERLHDIVLVPERAVIRSADHQAVVVAGADGVAHIVAVEVLGRHAGTAGIAGAVNALDRVVVEGGYNLPDGARVLAAETGDPAEIADPESGVETADDGGEQH